MSGNYDIGSDLSSDRFGLFYNKATAHLPNKFEVILYGEYIDVVIPYMRKSSITNRKDFDKTGVHRPIDSISFDRWYNNHVVKNGTNYEIHFKWACSSVNIPIPSIVTSDNRVIMETYKNLQYTVVSDYKTSSELVLSVYEERGMMWYQFFNALSNLFYHPELLTPRSSVFKLSAVVRPYIVTSDKSEWPRNELSQYFEYNSIVLKGLGSIKLSQSSSTPLTYGSVSFVCPNPFQKSFKSKPTGMLDNLSDSKNVIFSDKKNLMIINNSKMDITNSNGIG